MNKVIYEVCEEGYERHDGEFYQCFYRTDNIDKAKKYYQKELEKIKQEEDFFLKDYLEDAEENENWSEAVDFSYPLPIFRVEEENGDEWYELYICTAEVDCEE